MKGSIHTIESLGAVDGPGLRTVVFLNRCFLRCKYCHNPEMWNMAEENYTPQELVEKIVKNKPYFKNGGGVTFSGGEPLLQINFLIETCKLLKQENIHIALDTAGYGLGKYEELLDYIDLIIFDIKEITPERYKNLTGGNIEKSWEFLKVAKSKNKKFWIRQVMVPELHDNYEFLEDLAPYIKEHFNISNIEKIEFLPYHKLGTEKYERYNIPNPYKEKYAMDKDKCQALYQQFMKIYESKF